MVDMPDLTFTASDGEIFSETSFSLLLGLVQLLRIKSDILINMTHAKMHMQAR